MKRLYYILLFPCFSTFQGTAQNIDLKISFNDAVIKTSKIVNHNEELPLSKIKEELSDVLTQLQQKAYLTATFDSIIIDSSHYHAYINLGKTYQWTSLTNKNIDEEILSKIGFRDKLYNNRPFNEKQLTNFFKKIIIYYYWMGA